MYKKLLPIFLLLTSCFAFADHTVTIYGYVKLDVEYYDKNMGGLPSAPPTFTPLSTDKAAQSGECVVDARESRVGVEAKYEFSDIKSAAVVEGDFYTVDGEGGTGNGRHFRLRLAYGKADLPSHLSFMAGQYWSLLMNASIAQPLLVDFNGPVGALFARVPQFRIGYTHELPNNWGTLLLEGDIEKQAATDEGNINPTYLQSTAQGSGQKLPLFVGKITWSKAPFAIEVGGCGTQTSITKDAHGCQLQRGAWGAQFTAEIKPINKLTLYGSFRYLVGLSRLSNGDFIDAAINDFGQLIPVRTPGWYAGFNYAFTERTSLNGVYGWEKASRIPHSTFSGNAKGAYQSIHFNVLHSFWEHWKTGIEYQRFETKAFNGTHGHVNMLHFGIWFFF